MPTGSSKCEIKPDVIELVPYSRWDLDAIHMKITARMAARFGGFLCDVCLFDAFLLGTKDVEAGMMDPQHRLLLEVTSAALADLDRNVSKFS
jgi:acyl transferase domain-containing protein